MSEAKNESSRKAATSNAMLCANENTKRVLIVGGGFAPMEKALRDMGYSIERVAELPDKIKGMEFTSVWIDEIATRKDVADLFGI